MVILLDVFAARNCYRHPDLTTNSQRSLHEKGKAQVRARDQDAGYHIIGFWYQLLGSMALGRGIFAPKGLVRLSFLPFLRNRNTHRRLPSIYLHLQSALQEL